MTRHERYLKNYPERIGRERRERRRTVLFRKRQEAQAERNMRSVISHYLKSNPMPQGAARPTKNKPSLLNRLFKPSV